MSDYKEKLEKIRSLASEETSGVAQKIKSILGAREKMKDNSVYSPGLFKTSPEELEKYAGACGSAQTNLNKIGLLLSPPQKQQHVSSVGLGSSSEKEEDIITGEAMLNASSS